VSRAEGIEKRHQRACRSHGGGRCNCRPSYRASVWDQRARQRIRETFQNLDEAKAWRADALGARRKGTLSKPSRLFLYEAAEVWLAGVKDGSIKNRSKRPYKPSAIRAAEAGLRLHVLPQLGTLRLSDVRHVDVVDFTEKMERDGFSASTIRNAVTPLRRIFQYHVKRGELAVNPALGLELGAGGRRTRAADRREVADLLAVLPEEDRALWATAAYANLRRGELRALRWEDVDFDAGVIHVERGWDDKEGPVAPKSEAGVRTVPMAALLRSLLLEHRLRSGRSEGLAFGRTADLPFTPSHIRKRALKAWETENEKRRERGEEELAPIGLHELRHAFASLARAAELDLKAIQTYMGHSSSQTTTDLYSHLFKEEADIAAGRLDAYLTPEEDAEARARLRTVRDAE